MTRVQCPYCESKKLDYQEDGGVFDGDYYLADWICTCENGHMFCYMETYKLVEYETRGSRYTEPLAIVDLEALEKKEGGKKK